MGQDSLQEVRVMTLDQALFAVEVLRTPIGGYDSTDSPAVMQARQLLKADYDKTKHEHPDWSFGSVSRYVRSYWLMRFANQTTNP